MNIGGDVLHRILERHDSDVQWCAAYGERGYDSPEKGIIFANWNNVPDFISSWLESHGYAIEWSDEWIMNDDCNKAYRQSPDCYGWTPYFVLSDDCSVYGGDEIENEQHIQEWYVDEYLLNNERVANLFKVDLHSHGFRKFNGDYESGWHLGQTDSPDKEAAKIRAAYPDHDFVFQIDDVGQFDSHWSAWIRPQDWRNTMLVLADQHIAD